MRKVLTVALVSLFICSAAFATAPKPRTEFTFSGSYVNPDEGKAVWNVGFEPLFPITKGGILILGPSVVVTDNDDNTGAGAALEVNVPGQSGGFFFGGQALYYLDSEEGQDKHTTSGRAGIKLPISKSGLFKVYLQKGLSGRDRDNDLSGVLAAAIKF
jgi:hypothetical protein